MSTLKETQLHRWVEDDKRSIRELARRFDVLVIAGGDGTFSDAINSVSTDETTIAFLPLGTGNAMAHALHYRGNREPIYTPSYFPLLTFQPFYRLSKIKSHLLLIKVSPIFLEPHPKIFGSAREFPTFWKKSSQKPNLVSDVTELPPLNSLLDLPSNNFSRNLPSNLSF